MNYKAIQTRLDGLYLIYEEICSRYTNLQVFPTKRLEMVLYHKRKEKNYKKLKS